MAFQSMVGTSMLLAASLALCGCQTTPARKPTNPGFTQKQAGSANPPLVNANPSAQPGAPAAPTNSTTPTSGFGGIPTPAPATTGSQSRSTQPFIPTSGPAPANFGNPNPTPPAVSSAGGPALDPPLMPPTNPAFGRP